MVYGTEEMFAFFFLSERSFNELGETHREGETMEPEPLPYLRVVESFAPPVVAIAMKSDEEIFLKTNTFKACFLSVAL